MTDETRTLISNKIEELKKQFENQVTKLEAITDRQSFVKAVEEKEYTYKSVFWGYLRAFAELDLITTKEEKSAMLTLSSELFSISFPRTL